MTAPNGQKLWRRVILRGIGAVVFGGVVVLAGVALLSGYGISHGHVHHVKTATIKAIKFPENEQMLNEMTARLAREGEALSKVEPAAGTSKKSK